MLNGPRICPNTFSTASAAFRLSGGSSDTAVIGGIRGIAYFPSLLWRIRSIQPRDRRKSFHPAFRHRACCLCHNFREVAMTIFADSDVWDFRKDDRGEWAWQRQSVLGEVMSESRQRFGEFDDC